MSIFKKATKTQSKLRMALYGVSGSGKTFTALAIAKGLGGRVAVIDTERGSASKYAHRFEFDVLDMQPPYSPAAYVKAIHDAEAEGYDVLIIDSLTHAWAGTGGALEMVDNAAKKSQSSNSYVAWRDVTPEHNKLIDAMLQSRCNLIATMRSKVEYVMEQNERGKMVPRKKAMAPVQRDGMEYEFDLVCEMDVDNNLIVQKSRCETLTGQVIAKPNGTVSNALKAWLSDGAPVTTVTPETTQSQQSGTDTTAKTGGDASAPVDKRSAALKRIEVHTNEVKALEKRARDAGDVGAADDLAEVVKHSRTMYADRAATIGELHKYADSLKELVAAASEQTAPEPA